MTVVNEIILPLTVYEHQKNPSSLSRSSIQSFNCNSLIISLWTGSTWYGAPLTSKIIIFFIFMVSVKSTVNYFFPLLSINSFFFFYSRVFSLLFFIFIQRFCKCGAPPEAGGPMLKHLKHICWSGSDQSMPFTSINSQVKSNQAGFYWHRWRANVRYLF